MIYLADDNPDNRLVLERVLRHACGDISVRAFTDGLALLDHLAEATVPPRLILLDLHMPVLNGQQTLKVLKQHVAWREIPVVIISSGASSQEIDACYQQGADEVVLRPVEWPLYVTTVQRICDLWLQHC